MLSQLIPVSPSGSTIFAYGFLGGPAPAAFHNSMLTKGITIKGFSNFQTEAVQNPEQLAEALDEISRLIHLPFFKFKADQLFALEDIDAALAYVAADGSKAVSQTGN